MKDIGEKRRLPIASLINTQDPQKMVDHAEKKYASQLQRLSAEIAESGKKIVLLSGPSSSGKTTTANEIMEYLCSFGQPTVVISLDNFYKNREDIGLLPDGQKDFEALESLDTTLFDNLVGKILRGEAIHVPVYDFVTGQRTNKTMDIPDRQNLLYIFEGIHALNPKLSPTIHPEACVKIYINTHTDYVSGDGHVLLGEIDLRLARRLVRDYFHRGIQAEHTFVSWPDVMEGEIRYIRPYLHLADYHINSVHSYEPMLFKDFVLGIIAKMKGMQEQGSAFAKLFAGLDSLPADHIPLSSMMQEFLPFNENLP